MKTMMIAALLAASSLCAYAYSGAVCNDGYISYSTGPGTCSHHGGVKYWF